MNIIKETNEQVLYIKKIKHDAIIPSKAHVTDAGFDLYTPIDFILIPQQIIVIKIGIAMTVPKNTYGRIASKSGLSSKYGIHVLCGVIDRSYTDEIGVILINSSNKPKEFKKHNKIAQLIITSVIPVKIMISKNLTIKSRGGGFGSTGI